MMEGIEGKPESKPFIKGYKEYHTDTSVLVPSHHVSRVHG